MNSNVKSDNRSSLGYVTAMCLAFVLAAFNAQAGNVRSETVKFGDLNLGSPAGVEALYGRIHAAARRVCGRPAGEQTGVSTCMAKAESDAIRRVDVPLLTAYYQNKTRSHPQTIIAYR